MLQWLWGHLVAYLPGFPEGLFHCRLLLGQGWVSTICLRHSLAGVIFLSELSARSQQGALEHS